MTDVLPGFEDEVAAEARARAAAIEARRLAASIPTVSDPDKDGVRTLTRTHPWEDLDGEQHAAVTVRLTPPQWAVIETAVLAQYGLTPITERTTP